MITRETLEGNWNEIKGKMRSKWGALTDDDVTVFNGDLDQLMGTIQRKTGDARESVEQFFEQFNSGAASAISRAGESVRAGAEKAADSVQETYQNASASVREKYADVEDMVRQRPAKSLAICFAAGVMTGVVAILLLRRR